MGNSAICTKYSTGRMCCGFVLANLGENKKLDHQQLVQMERHLRPMGCFGEPSLLPQYK